MVKMINRFGGITFVSEERVEEYLGAGHVLAPSDSKPEPEKKAVPKKRTTKTAKK